MENKSQISIDELEIITAQSFDEIEAIRPIWEEMQSNETYPVINANIDRYISVIKASNDYVRPYIIFIKKNDHPLLMLIARVENHKLSFKIGYKNLFNPRLKCLTVVYGGFLGDQTSSSCEIIISCLRKLLSNGEFDMVRFSHLKTNSVLYNFEKKLLSLWERGCFNKKAVHWAMAVPPNMDVFYKSLPPKFRSNLKRHRRKIEKNFPDDVKFVVYDKPEQLNEVFEYVSQISSTTYQHGMGCGFTDNLLTRELLTTAAEKGWLRTDILFVKGQPCAFQMGLIYKNIYFGEQTGFDPQWSHYRVGTVILLNVFQDLCGIANVKCFDFGFGDADYKRSYGTEHWQECTINFFASRPYPIFLNLLTSSAIWINYGATFMLKEFKVINFVKRKWRNLLQKKHTKN